MTDQEANFEDDRRTYYRIDDDVYLEYLILTENDIEGAIKEFKGQSPEHFNPLNQLQAISVRNRGLLENIRQKHPELGEFLVGMEEQIQLLAHAIAQDQVGVPIVPNENVNISAGGISFSSEQALNTGTMVEFSIIIVPAYLHISALGAVVYCRRDSQSPSDYPYRIGVEFSHIHDADRDALLRHVSSKRENLVQ
jgi:hypothetical protein